MNEVLFEQMDIIEPIKRAVADMGYVNATPIQARSIPHILEGLDVIGRSQTGTGKTAAFGIPAISLIDKEIKGKVQVLVLCPTRELAIQAGEEITKFSAYMPHIKTAVIYGGASIEKQISQLRGGANIVIGTPGRVMDHMRRKTLKFENLKMVILDEADEMLNMGFREDIELILSATPEERQTVLFSATMPAAILNITKQFQKDPIIVQIGAENTAKPMIEQYYYEVPPGKKPEVLALLLHTYNPKLSIIFCNTKMMVDELSEYLNAHGFESAGIHGDMKQAARTLVMGRFKSHRTPILIATDVAARGIDVENVDAVFNFDIPQDTEYYIHRIGRTARAGKTGTAFTLVSGRKQYFQLRDIERLTSSKIQPKPIPRRSDVLKQKRAGFISELLKNCDLHGESSAAGLMLDELLQNENDIDLKAIATTLLALAYSEDNLDIPEVTYDRKAMPPRTGAPGTGGSVHSAGMGAGSAGVVLGVGRKQRVAPNFVVSALADATGLSGKAFGKIEIFDNHTIVHMSKENVDHTLNTLDVLKINGFRATVKNADSAPKKPYTPRPGTPRRAPRDSRFRR